MHWRMCGKHGGGEADKWVDYEQGGHGLVYLHWFTVSLLLTFPSALVSDQERPIPPDHSVPRHADILARTIFLGTREPEVGILEG